MKVIVFCSLLLATALCKGQFTSTHYYAGASAAYNGAAFNDFTLDDSFHPTELYSLYFGKFLSSQTAIGLRMGAGTKGEGQQALYYHLSPFLRNCFPIKGKWYFVVDAGLGFYFGRNTSDQLTSTLYSGEFSVSPGLMYQIHKNLLLEAKAISLGVGYGQTSNRIDTGGVQAEIITSKAKFHSGYWPISIGLAYLFSSN
jgi:hypothetical protein